MRVEEPELVDKGLGPEPPQELVELVVQEQVERGASKDRGESNKT